MTVRPMPLDGRPVCAAPKWRAAVDASMNRPGGEASLRLRREACPICPVRADCLRAGVASSEHGAWGGTSPTFRGTLGASQPSLGKNMAGIDHGIGAAA